MEPTLNIEVGKTGVRRVVSRPTTVSEANETSLITARISFPLRMLHETLNGESTDPIKEIDPQIFVPRSVDEEIGVVEFEQMNLAVAEPVRPIDHRHLPSWLIAALKRAHPRHYVWANADDLPGGVSEAAWQILVAYEGKFLEHYGIVDDERRGQILVTEPYSLSQEQMGTLMEFVTDADLALRFTGTSNHYPSTTLRVEIWKP